VRKLAPLALLAVLVLASGAGAASPKQSKPVYAGTCGLPNSGPLWIDFGWPDFADTFGRPGVIVSASSGDFPARMRAAGAKTVYWDMYLNKRVGQPNTPADPATIVDKANKLYEFAAGQMQCTTPVIVENELFGANLATPWSDTNAQYRQNVLTFIKQLASRGAYPVLLTNSDAYTAGDAGVWWQQVAAVSDIVREAYIPAPLLYQQGPIVGSRTLRAAYRRDLQQFTSIGIPPNRLGLITTTATTRGFGGRNGLEPASAWYEVVKWQSFAMRQVAAETGIGSLWSWGWGSWTAVEKDPDKQGAACVWLWARNPRLCDGETAAGPGFDASRTEGQIRLSPGVQCSVAKQRISNDAIQRLQLVTGDRDVAFTALYTRLVEANAVKVTSKRIAAAERAIVNQRFHGSWRDYGAALAAVRATRSIALGIIGDGLRREAIEADLRVGKPTSAAVVRFYRSYPDVLVRRVKTKTPAPWLGNKKEGFALSSLAPEALFSLPLGRASTLRTPLGVFKVTPLGATEPLGAVPLESVRGAVSDTLREFKLGEAYEKWTAGQQARTLRQTICARDDLPAPGSVDLSTYLPFLSVER
jgi:hypothetical protein